VHVSVEAGPVKLGRFPEGLDESIKELAKLLKNAGINVETSAAIKSDLWAKTLYNCALNPLGAIMGVPYGNLTDPAAGRIIDHLIHEAFAVVIAEGVTLPWATADEYLTYLRNVQIPATSLHRSSMLQDITRGKKTEIDFINGAVVQKGKLHSVPTPYNSCIVDLIKFRETLACGEDIF
jgi:2-dehydropantoate 2-reductase